MSNLLTLASLASVVELGLSPNTASAAKSAKSASSCSLVFDNTAQNRHVTVSLPHLKATIQDLGRALEGEYLNDKAHKRVSTYNAFFAYLRGSDEDALTRFDSLEISSADFQNSWRVPIELKPLPITLFRGHLFPNQYYYRRALVSYREDRLASREQIGVGPLAFEMPFVKLNEDGSYALSRANGSRKLFELWSRDLNGNQKIRLYRGASKVEANVQQFVQQLLSRRLDEKISQEEITRLEQLTSLDQYESHNSYHHYMMEWLIRKLRAGEPDRQTTTDEISNQILSGGLFMTPDINVARRFSANLITYEISPNSLHTLFDQGLYLGVEYGYLEFVADGSLGSQAKLDIIKSLVLTKN